MLGVATPSTIIILLIAFFLKDINLDIPAVQGAFTGAQAAITGLIALTAVRMTRKTIRNSFTLIAALASVIATIVFRLFPVWVILAGAVLGIVYQFSVSAVAGSKKESDR